MPDLVVVARFASRSECVVAQSVLRAAGIETLMPDFNVLTSDFDPSMMESGWRLMVRQEDRVTAQSILKDAQESAAEPD
jgi:hypothetical protein